MKVWFELNYVKELKFNPKTLDAVFTHLESKPFQFPLCSGNNEITTWENLIEIQFKDVTKTTQIFPAQNPLDIFVFWSFWEGLVLIGM